MNRFGLPPAFVALLFTLPLVQVGTIRLGIRFLPADLIAMGLFAYLLVTGAFRGPALQRHPAITAAAVAAVVLGFTSLAGSAISLLWITPGNFQSWPLFDAMIEGQGTPLERATVENLRLVQCVAAFLVTLAVVRTREQAVAAAGIYAAGATAVAAYGLYVWVVMVGELSLPVLPGTFSYLHLKRTAATFPEPVAYAGYALTGIALTLWRLERHRTPMWFGALGIQILALVTTLSTFGLVGLAGLWIAHVLGTRLRVAVGLTLAVAVAAVVVLSIVPPEIVRRAVTKPFTAQASWLDRLTAWRTAATMAAAHPIAGIGTGLYAFNQEPFFPHGASLMNSGGRVNSAALELTAETGLIGLTCALIILWAAAVGSAGGRHGPLGLRGIVVLLVLAAGYYTSRYAFIWVYAALLIASGMTVHCAGAEHRRAVACAS